MHDAAASDRFGLPPTLTRHWVRWTVLLWALAAGVMIFLRRVWVQGLLLPDTDDNMRLMQVRGLLHGQGWYDLRQYALNAPFGANIHWSRLVDLPIAGLILLFRPLVGNDIAERLASAIAPTLPYLVMLLSLAVLVRRLVHPLAYPAAIFLTFCSFAAMGMFMPMRIDHHGWQLAFLVMTLAGMADDRPLRSGAIIGFASAASLTIGLEMIAYLALAGAAVVLRWVVDGRDADRMRMRAFGVVLAGGCLLGYGGFASFDNARPMCDALSPVWVSMMLGAGAAAVALSVVPARSLAVRLGAAGVAGALILYGFVHFWPDCVGRPEHVSAAVDRIWLSNVREAKPIYTQDRLQCWGTLALPIAGVVGTLLTLWQRRAASDRMVWGTIALFTLAAFALLLWQTRAGPAAQLIAIPGAVALGWWGVPRIQRSSLAIVRVLGTVGLFLFVSGIGVSGIAQLSTPKAKPQARTVRNTSGQCFTVPALAALNKLPPATMFTHVDFAPRLITLTHHRAIMGPYHRNGDQILDVYTAFDGPPDQARQIMAKYGATMLLTCPGLSETTVYRARAPQGFYAQIIRGQVPPWLSPVALPAGSPFKLWAIAPLPPAGAQAQ